MGTVNEDSVGAMMPVTQVDEVMRKPEAEPTVEEAFDAIDKDIFGDGTPNEECESIDSIRGWEEGPEIFEEAGSMTTTFKVMPLSKRETDTKYKNNPKVVIKMIEDFVKRNNITFIRYDSLKHSKFTLNSKTMDEWEDKYPGISRSYLSNNPSGSTIHVLYENDNPMVLFRLWKDQKGCFCEYIDCYDITKEYSDYYCVMNLWKYGGLDDNTAAYELEKFYKEITSYDYLGDDGQSIGQINESGPDVFVDKLAAAGIPSIIQQMDAREDTVEVWDESGDSEFDEPTAIDQPAVFEEMGELAASLAIAGAGMAVATGLIAVTCGAIVGVATAAVALERRILKKEAAPFESHTQSIDRTFVPFTALKYEACSVSIADWEKLKGKLRANKGLSTPDYSDLLQLKFDVIPGKGLVNLINRLKAGMVINTLSHNGEVVVVFMHDNEINMQSTTTGTTYGPNGPYRSQFQTYDTISRVYIAVNPKYKYADYYLYMTIGWFCSKPDGVDPHQAIRQMSIKASQEAITEEWFELADGSIFTESAKIDDDIKPIIDTLNGKGYKTISSCSGHPSARSKNDVYRDGVKHGKLYSAARAVFDKDYKFKSVPEGWELQRMDDGKTGIYVKGKTYNVAKGMVADQFYAWKKKYMAALKSWADALPNAGSKSKNINEEGPEIFEEEANDELASVVEDIILDVEGTVS